MIIKMKTNSFAGNRSVITILSLFLSFLFCSCEKLIGEGPVVTQERTVQNFKAVSSGIGARVTYTVSPVVKLELKAQQNILDVVEAFVSGGELILKFKDNVNLGGHEQIIVDINGPSPESINIHGSGGCDIIGDITGDKLKLGVTGSGNIKLGNTTLSDKLEAIVTGSGNILFQEEGSAKTMYARIAGSGNIQSAKVTVQNAEAEISGSGNISVKATDNLLARISGSGTVYYAGSPVITTQISGSGSVRPL